MAEGTRSSSLAAPAKLPLRLIASTTSKAARSSNMRLFNYFDAVHQNVAPFFLLRKRYHVLYVVKQAFEEGRLAFK
jgi:hypothetical protein